MRTPRKDCLGVWTIVLAGVLLFLPVTDSLAAFQPVRPILECVTQEGPSQYTAVYGYKNENTVPFIIPMGSRNKFTPLPQDRGQPTVFWPGRTPPDRGVFQVPFDGGDLVWTLKGPDGSTRTATASSSSRRCPGPTLTGLDPVSVFLTQGGRGALTATIGAAQPGTTTITLRSSDPAIASVPASVSIPAGQEVVTVPVAAGNLGIAVVTAFLNGSSRHSAIIVLPGGPTLSSLVPATIQIAQGATGMLTATISAAQGSDTVVPLSSTDAGIVNVPATVTVPAGAVSVPVPVAAVAPGSATVTAGPLNRTLAQSQVIVIAPAATVVGLAPAVLRLSEGSAGTLTVTLNASQPADTEVALVTSDPTIVGLPGDRVNVPAHSASASFTVISLSRGTATVTASANGASATSAVTVQPPPPTVSALTCPATLTASVTSQCAVTLNATQLDETVVPLASSDPGIVSIPNSVTIPAGAVAVAVPVVADSPGTATITAGPLNETSRQATVQVLPPPPTLVGLTPSPAMLLVGASTTVTLTLNAAQPTDTAVALAGSPAGIVNVPASVTVPAGQIAVPVPVTALTPGSAVLTAGPLNGSTVAATVTVNQLPPAVTALTPSEVALSKGTADSLTVTIAPVQVEPTTVPLTSNDPATVEVPASVPVPAGSATAAFPVIGRNVGTATVTAGPLGGTTAATTVTVTPPALVALTIAPTAVTLAVGQAQPFVATGTYTDGTTQDLTSAAAWTSGDDAIATVTTPGGVVTARAVGQAIITATAEGKTATATVTVTPPTLTVLALTPTQPTRGVGQLVQFQVTGTYTDGTTQNLTGTVTWTSSNTVVASITSPGGLATALAAGQSTITATHAAGMSASTTLFVTAPVVVSLTISPQNPTKTIGRTLQFTATGTYSDGTTQTLTAAVTWTSNSPAVAIIASSGGLATAVAEGQTIITATYAVGLGASTTLTATILPPDPVSVAPPVSQSAATALAPATEFLYMGPDPVQTDVVPGAIEAGRAAVLRGRVLTRDGNPLSGVNLSVLNHPEYGATLSRTDGMFDLAVNGGSQLTLRYQKAGYLPAQRPITVAWQNYAWLPDVALIPYDTRVTTVDLGAPTPIQVARGNSVTDNDGTRQATLFFLQGTTATIQLSDGSTQPLTTLSVRATEYTVGPNGPKAMPGPLPTTTSYTYCAALTLDEALSAGARRVQFSQPVITYVENFVGFPVGGIVPLGYYDRTAAAWVPSDNGRVVKILSVTSGLAELDISGSGAPASPSALAALGITNAERGELAALYTPGQSLWRLPIPHFSDWDANWGWGPPPGAAFWDGDVSVADACPPCVRSEAGSIIHPQTQTLGETVNLAGTPIQLHYASDRLAGRTTARTLEIPVTKETLPTGLKRVEMEFLVAGQRQAATLPAQPNQTYPFAWDGYDGYGRALYGAHAAVIRVGYVYDGAYQQPAQLYKAFGYSGNGQIAALRTRQEVTLWQEARTRVGTGGDARADGLGGWTLDVHHSYDPGGQVLRLGDGTQRRASDVGTVISTTTTGAWWAATFDGQGNLFYASGHQIRKRTPAGVVTVVAGTVTAGFSGDGGPAINAQLNSPYGMSVDAQGTLFFADYYNHRIRKVTPDGIITTVAGDGSCCGPGEGGGNFTGDGGPATAAGLELPWGVTVDGQGNLFIADTGNSRIRKVTPDGIIQTIAGGGNPYLLYCGDGGPATAACLRWPAKVAIDQHGNLFIPDHVNNRIRKVTPEGIISTVAGTGPSGAGGGGYAGDGGPATAAQINGPLAVAVDTQGNLYIPDHYNHRVRLVNPQGVITTIAGTGTAGFSGDGGPATSAQINAPRAALLDPQGTLHIADAANGRIRKIAPALPGVTTQDITIPSADGAELYVFSSGGRHLRTHRALTGAVRYTFGYDPDGRLATVTDGDNNVTAIERDSAGRPTTIVTPDGQRTTLTVDANGYLATVVNPAGEAHRFTSTSDGLLQTMTTPRNQTYRFAFDALGRLTRDEDPAGGVKTLDRTGTGNTYTVALTTALTRVSTFHVEPLATGGTRQVDTEPDGTQTETRTGTDGITTTTMVDGTVTTLKKGPDPRFGMQAPIPSALTLRMPSGLTSSLAMTRAVTLSNPSNLLSVTSQTDTLTLNGRTATSTYTASTKTRTDRSPANRVASMTLDAQGRVVRAQADSLEPVAFTYDPRGRLSTVVQGTGGTARTSTFAYNPEGFLETITDPLNRTVRFTYDPAGRVLTQILPDLRVIQTTYDANGNVAAITPPSRPAHAFDYTPIELEASYAPPDLGIGPVATTYTYNQDRQLTQVTRPDGQMLTLDYEPTGGRLTTLTAPTGQTTFTYHPTSGTVTTIGSPGGVGLSYTYDGSLLAGTAWTGPVTGSVTRTYDTDFRVATESVNGGNPVTLQYDPDSLLTLAGSLTLTRHPQHGLLTGTALGAVTDAYTYSTFGELDTYQASYNSSSLLNSTYTRDALGRITQKTETIGGTTTTTTAYGYDTAGRLTDVTVDGVLTAHYAYDGNGNRLSVTRPVSGTVSGIYDAQDRVTTYGAIVYAYTSNGDLLTATSGGETTTYAYDVFGNLTAVTLPAGTQIAYVIDGQNRWIGKRVNGVLTQGYLYGSQLRPAAELDGSGAIVSRFVYGTRINVPHYMEKGGATYRLLTDHLGSVRLVVNTATGAIAQRLDYDEFGQMTTDTAPGFQPFGFAGGLYDPDTKFVRFGARDYDAFTGRWTTKDPIGFGGGDVNLYGYALNSPPNLIDPLGLEVQICLRPLSGPPPFSNYSHTFLYSTDTRTGYGLGPKPGWELLAPWMKVPGQIENDYPYDSIGRIKPQNQCTTESTYKCVEDCVNRKARDATRLPPGYKLGTYQCDTWASDLLRQCKRECDK